MSGPESAVERALTRRAVESGGLSLKWVSPGTAGVPDRIVLLPCGCTWLVELKAPGGRLSARQRQMHARMARVAHPVAVMWTLAQVETWATQMREHLGQCRREGQP